jgi:hypothetical protein
MASGFSPEFQSELRESFFSGRDCLSSHHDHGLPFLRLRLRKTHYYLHMKTPILISIFVALAGTWASAAELSVFRVCQDQRVIRTSDGAEAGRVEYIVVDPSNREVVSTIIGGGVVGERLIAIPYDSLRFNGDREITLNEITRERLVSAPAIERTQINAAVIDPGVIERTRTHFGGRGDVNPQRTTTESAAATSRTNEARPNGAVTNGGRPNAEATTPGGANARGQAETGANRGRENATRQPNANAPDAATTNRPNANTETANPRNEGTNAEPQSTRGKKANAARPENAGQNAPANETNKATPNERSKAQAAERDAGKAGTQNEAEKRGSKAPAEERNAAEEATKGRKPAEENATETNTGKRPSKKTPGSTEDKQKEERPPQL